VRVLDGFKLADFFESTLENGFSRFFVPSDDFVARTELVFPGLPLLGRDFTNGFFFFVIIIVHQK
jgi:hypothetical protein